MRKNTILLLTLMMILALPKASFAEETVTTAETIVEETKQARPTRAMVKEELKERREMMEQKRNDVKADLEAKREEAQEKFAERREEFKAKLEEITDEKKQAIVERTDERLAALNERLTNRMLEHLTKISEVLDRIEAGAAEKGDSTLDDAITVARASIETSQTAIETQAGQEYIVIIGEEDELRTAVKKVVDQFRTDMRATADKVKEARAKTVEAARMLESMKDDTQMMEEPPARDESGG